jgi:hypothetical protein
MRSLRSVAQAAFLLAVAQAAIGQEPQSRVLREADLAAGKRPAVGDTVLLSDFTRCFPRSAISTENVKGKWWLRSFRTSEGEGKMLCVEQYDRDSKTPQDNLAPTLTLPLELEGVYDIWIGTYRPVYGGGLDIKLTRDKVFGTVDPWEEELRQWPPRPDQTGKLVEMFFKTADLTGQDLHLRQPHGTYQSYWWGLCNAHCAYIKLVRRAPEEVQREAAALAQQERKGVVIDRDGMSYGWMWGTEDLDCMLQQVEQFQYGNVEALNWCIGSTFWANFPHPASTGFSGYGPMGGRLGDHRFDRIDRSFRDRGIDVLQILVDRCHELGIKIYVSERMSEGGSTDALRAHPEWLNGHGGYDYAVASLREFLRDYLLYIAENYDIDGLTIDFSRCRSYFKPGEAKPEYMTSFLQELRKGLDEIGQARGKRLVLNATFVTGTWYEGRTAEEQALDVQTWVNQRLVDCIMPEGKQVAKYIQMCQGTPTRCYGRYSTFQDFAGDALQANVHDPTPDEDRKDAPPLAHLGPKDILQGTLDWYTAGASGVFLFNQSDAWTTLRHLPYPDLLRQELTPDHLFGKREGPAVTWAQ